MATIIKRKSKYSVVYYVVDENGVKRQKWESFDTNAAARKRKAEIEHQQDTNTFIAPSALTLSDLLDQYVTIYGVNTWAPSTYEGHKSLIDNYIRPLIGDKKLDDINPRMMDHFYKQLKTVKAKARPYGVPKDGFITPRTIREIHKLLRNAFNQAVKWELMSRNPVQNATLPKCEEHEREIWDTETLFRAIDLCDDDILKLALHLSFACSLRLGELLGLTWDCIDISQESIESGRAYVYIDKELQRVSREALSQTEEHGVKLKFPSILACRHTVLVLKEPKTKTSVRKVFLPRSVAEMLVERKKDIEELKELLGDEYTDYNLVFASSSGTPTEGSTINRLFSKLISDNGLPKVVFHSIRHTSTTYKLMLSGGDIKGVQGDTGHAQASMVTERYAHILDDNRRMNAERFQQQFYSGPASEEPAAQPDPLQQLDAGEKQALLIKLLAESPEMANMIKSLAQAM